MRVLGLGGSHHDFCACLVENGNVVSGIEEERLTRVKYAFGLGARLQRCHSAEYVLSEAGATIDDVDLVVANDFLNRVFTVRYRDRIEWIGHHLSHAASAFYTSPFSSAAILVVDGRGSEVIVDDERFGETISTFVADHDGVRLLNRQAGRVTRADRRSEDPYEDSIGWMYEAASKCIGFVSRATGMGEPGKTMGLAPYGSDRFVDQMGEFYDFRNGRFRQSTDQQMAMRSWMLSTVERAGAETEALRADIAYAVQEHTEQVMVDLVSRLHAETGQRALCLAGGVALNSVANLKILERTPFEEIYIVPAAGDSGTALGAALYGYHDLGGVAFRPSPEPFSPYLGRNYTQSEIDAAIADHRSDVSVRSASNVEAVAAKALAGGAIVGWFQGRSESGPRALGNRSILADPRQASMKDHLNDKVKHREPFRPFAPVVLEDDQADYFTTTVPSFHMLLVCGVRPEKRSVIPAVTHVDGSARLQTTNPQLNPRLSKLLAEFRRLTGIGVLLNTSFNDNNEPIVETPQDALRCFLNTQMDLLVLGDRIVEKVPTLVRNVDLVTAQDRGRG